MTLEVSGSLSGGFYHVILFIALGISLLYVMILHWFKKRRGEGIGDSGEFSTKDIIFQRVRPGYDERDLLIWKKAANYGRMALYLAFCLVIFSGFAWTRTHGSQSFTIDSSIILLIIAGVLLFKYVVTSLATIIQYRLGK